MSSRILVGVDGTDRSVAALRWAARHAAAVGAPVLDVVTAWDADGGYGGAPLAVGHPVPAGGVGLLVGGQVEQALTAQAREVNDRCLEAAGIADGPVQVRTWVKRGPPGRALVEIATGDDLLVVGSSGHGPVVGALLGTVVSHLTTHAPCPVVVVRGDDG